MHHEIWRVCLDYGAGAWFTDDVTLSTSITLDALDY
jgi:hypothetical protein